jgi:hypothetical protein
MSNALINAGFEKEQAEVVVNTTKDAVDEKNREMATKQDVKNLKELLFFGFGGIGFALAYIITKLG